MSGRPVLVADELSLLFPVRGRVQAPKDPRFVLRGGRAHRFRALSGVSFVAAPGDRIALIGRNGSGKSTLLRVLAGIYPPTAGRCAVSGHVEALFNLSMGVNPFLSGRRNVLLIGMMRGHTRAEVVARTPEIEAFSRLGGFLDLPVQTYSQGMRARLLFSIVTAFSPEVLLLDEWFGAGDEAFNRRAGERVDQLITGTGVLMLASHNPTLLRRYCTRGLWLHDGELRMAGSVEDCLKAYAEDDADRARALEKAP